MAFRCFQTVGGSISQGFQGNTKNDLASRVRPRQPVIPPQLLVCRAGGLRRRTLMVMTAVVCGYSLRWVRRPHWCSPIRAIARDAPTRGPARAGRQPESPARYRARPVRATRSGCDWRSSSEGTAGTIDPAGRVGRALATAGKLDPRRIRFPARARPGWPGTERQPGHAAAQSRCKPGCVAQPFRSPADPTRGAGGPVHEPPDRRARQADRHAGRRGYIASYFGMRPDPFDGRRDFIPVWISPCRSAIRYMPWPRA